MSHNQKIVRRLCCMALALGQIVGASAFAAQEPPGRMPTVEEILRQETRPARPASPAPTRPTPPTAPQDPDPATLLNRLPTVGDILAQSRKPTKVSCTRPETIGDVPDGTTATDEAMKTAQAAMKKFVAEAQTFQSCLILAQAEAWGSLSVADYLALEGLYVQMQRLLEVEAERFNIEVREFKGRAAAPAPTKTP